MKSLITSSDLSIAETNAGKESLIEQLTNTNVLEVVETQLGLNGKNLLQEAINLLLIPHNLPNNFGYKITGLSEANNLNDKNGFLARLGGVNSSYFEISKQDQLFRVREEFRELSVSVGEFRQYFGKLGIEFAEVPQSLSNDEMIPLNPAIEFEVENIEFYQHNKTDKKKDTLKAFYREKPSDFLLGALEKFYGTNHSDRVFMYHSVGYQLADDFRSFWVSEKNQYLLGPLFSPTSIDVSNPESFCYLDAPFDRLTPLKGCEDIQPSAHFIVDLYNEATEQLYLDKDELSPLSNIGGELGDILDASYFSSRYIVQYDKDQILKDLKYAKFAEQPEKWTRFDQLLANYFTADTKRTSNGQSITVGEIQHTYQYEQFYENFIRLKFDKKLLDIPSSAEKIFRSQLRGKIFSSVNSTEEIIDAILFREHTTSPEDYPEISLLKKDLQLPNQDDLWAWHSFTVDQKRSDGSLILVNREEFEIDKFANLQNITFKEYKCSLLPTESDSDYSPQMEQYIQSSASFCTSKVHKWLDYRSCQRSKKLKMALEKMKKENPEAQIIDRSVDCPSDL